MKKRIAVGIIIALYAFFILAFVYYDFVNFTPPIANILKYSTIVLSFLTAAFLWKDSFDRFDGTILVLAMAVTVVTDIFLVFRVDQFDIGMIFYGLTMTVYFFRYQKPKRAVILPFFLIIPAILYFVLHIELLYVAVSYYIQILITNIISAILCVRRGKYPKLNATLILLGLFIFILGDITVVLRNFPLFDIKIASKFIWIFYTPSQAILAFSSNNFAKDREKRETARIRKAAA